MAWIWRAGRCTHYLRSKRVDPHAVGPQVRDTMGQTASTQCDIESDEQRCELVLRSCDR